jgi:hypothetical protein
MASAQGSATFSVVAKDAASSVLRGVGKEMGNLGKTGGAVFKTLAAAAAVVATAITTAGAAALKFTQKAIQAAIEDDAEQQKLIATLKARGQTTEQATKRVNALIEAGAKLAFTDSEVRKGYEVATRFANKYSNQQKILTTAQDLARSSNISLEAATKIVGKAFDGSGKALKNYGIDLEKGVRGTKALDEINKKVGGVAEQFAKTFEGQFKGVRIAIDETVESIGFAIGGGEGLPTFTRLLEGIRPVVDDLIGEINKNLPNIEKFSRELVEKFLAKLPGYVATAKRELPILIKKAKDFIGSVAGFAKDIGTFLGPDGLITAGIAGVGLKMGGLAGGIGAVFAEQFIKMGIDPITASITGTIGGAITAGVVQGLGSAVAQAAISKFLGLFKSIPITPSIPTTVPGVAPVPGGGGSSFPALIGNVLKGLGLATAGVGVAEVKRQVDTRFTALSGNLLQDVFGKDVGGALSSGINFLKDVTTSLGPFGQAIKTLERLDPGGSKDVLGVKSLLDSIAPTVKDGVTDGLAPVAAELGRDINFTNQTTLTVDGRVLAQTVDRYLGPMYRAAGTTRTGGR